MKLSVNYGLPIAEEGDFATDYPATVDDPRTTAIDALLASNAVRPLGYAQFAATGLAIGIGKILLAPAVPPVVSGGLTWAADNSGFVVPQDGHYLATLNAMFDNVSQGQQAQALIGTPASHIWTGTMGQSLSGGLFYFGSTVTGIISALAGSTIAPWYNISGACNLNSANLFVSHISG